MGDLDFRSENIEEAMPLLVVNLQLWLSLMSIHLLLTFSNFPYCVCSGSGFSLLNIYVLWHCTMLNFLSVTFHRALTKHLLPAIVALYHPLNDWVSITLFPVCLWHEAFMPQNILIIIDASKVINQQSSNFEIPYGGLSCLGSIIYSALTSVFKIPKTASAYFWVPYFSATWIFILFKGPKNNQIIHNNWMWCIHKYN